ncbi:hypothetical protein I4F81_003055 [Pyropia yezoensis]|uniref:Uncharacterized protein n=1 Tax=Pyropia yezoensis TaxID=2788 RepID=A0ACC3BSQ7_PYRYE|nr:hypothetical protein I4F81_003055 [Neopyropia yezoensis]
MAAGAQKGAKRRRLRRRPRMTPPPARGRWHRRQGPGWVHIGGGGAGGWRSCCRRQRVPQTERAAWHSLATRPPPHDPPHNLFPPRSLTPRPLTWAAWRAYRLVGSGRRCVAAAAAAAAAVAAVAAAAVGEPPPAPPLPTATGRRLATYLPTCHPPNRGRGARGRGCRQWRTGGSLHPTAGAGVGCGPSAGRTAGGAAGWAASAGGEGNHREAGAKGGERCGGWRRPPPSTTFSPDPPPPLRSLQRVPPTPPRTGMPWHTRSRVDAMEDTALTQRGGAAGGLPWPPPPARGGERRGRAGRPAAPSCSSLPEGGVGGDVGGGGGPTDLHYLPTVPYLTGTRRWAGGGRVAKRRTGDGLAGARGWVPPPCPPLGHCPNVSPPPPPLCPCAAPPPPPHPP